MSPSIVSGRVVATTRWSTPATGSVERVAQVPQVAVDVLVLDLDVGERRRAARTPVDDALAAVDEALVEPVDEDLAHGQLVARVHREPLVRVVARAAHRLELADDRRAVLAPPLPARLDEPLAPDVVARQPLLGELLLDLVLRRDACVIRADDPAGRPADHALTPNHDVLDGVVQRVAHVQRAGDVGRRNHDRVRPHALDDLLPEVAAVLPRREDGALDRRGVVDGGHLAHGRIPFHRRVDVRRFYQHAGRPADASGNAICSKSRLLGGPRE